MTQLSLRASMEPVREDRNIVEDAEFIVSTKLGLQVLDRSELVFAKSFIRLF